MLFLIEQDIQNYNRNQKCVVIPGEPSYVIKLINYLLTIKLLLKNSKYTK